MRILILFLTLALVSAVVIYSLKSNTSSPTANTPGEAASRAVNNEEALEEAKRAAEQLNKTLLEQQKRLQQLDTQP